MIDYGIAIDGVLARLAQQEDTWALTIDRSYPLYRAPLQSMAESVAKQRTHGNGSTVPLNRFTNCEVVELSTSIVNEDDILYYGLLFDGQLIRYKYSDGFWRLTTDYGAIWRTSSLVNAYSVRNNVSTTGNFPDTPINPYNGCRVVQLTTGWMDTALTLNGARNAQ